MRKIEAPTLADAYEKAAFELDCSITELKYEVIQHPSSGIMGMFKKSAIIVADCERSNADIEPIDEIMQAIAAEEIIEELVEAEEFSSPETIEETAVEETIERIVTQAVTENDTLPREKHTLDEALTQRDDAVLDSFFDAKEAVPEQRPENNNLELAEKIEAELAELLSHSCFSIDTVEVDVVENTALIFIDGDDAALLIGKEGYRYNALSYMLFNWLHTKYDLYIKLEIAQFLTAQQEMISNYIKPVIEHVNVSGRGKTRPLDGILVQIALEQLREAFPHKYVAAKTGRDGRKYIIINEFNTKRND
ncbi:MAG: Jag N-terminal domain-containing protein [Campylobacterota bacterium]|nr:Jag N-terminal domain-containing protein [Campylobacterota bacterium]